MSGVQDEEEGLPFYTDGLEYVHSEQDHVSPPFSHPLTHHSSGFRPRAIWHHHRFYNAGTNKSRAQAPHRINSGGVQKNAKTNPSSEGTRMLPPVHKHKNVDFQRQRIFSVYQRGPLRKRWKERRREESTTLVTNQHINLSRSPPSNSHKHRVQSIQKVPDVGRWVEWERERRGE